MLDGLFFCLMGSLLLNGEFMPPCLLLIRSSCNFLFTSYFSISLSFDLLLFPFFFWLLLACTIDFASFFCIEFLLFALSLFLLPLGDMNFFIE